MHKIIEHNNRFIEGREDFAIKPVDYFYKTLPTLRTSGYTCDVYFILYGSYIADQIFESELYFRESVVREETRRLDKDNIPYQVLKSRINVCKNGPFKVVHQAIEQYVSISNSHR